MLPIPDDFHELNLNEELDRRIQRERRLRARLRILKMPAYIATVILRNPPPRWSQFPNELESESDTQLTFDICSDFRMTSYSSHMLFPDSKFTSLDRLTAARSRALTCPLHDNSDTGAEFYQNMKANPKLKEFEDKYDCDVILQPDNVWRKNKRLVVFDMDSTLIQQEVIDEIAAFINKKAEVSAITERAMRGELDFASSLRARCALLEGVSARVFDTLKENGTITFTKGARNLCTALKRMGCKLAVISGGFQPLADWVKEQLGLDYAFANNLEVSDDGERLTGQLVGDIVDAERKASLLIDLAHIEGINIAQTVAIGDGANDLLMMHAAGFGIAFNAKPRVQAEAPAHLNTGDLQHVLYLFGVTAKEQAQLISPPNAQPAPAPAPVQPSSDQNDQMDEAQ